MLYRLVAAVLIVGTLLVGGVGRAADGGLVCGYSWDVMEHQINGAEPGKNSKLLPAVLDVHGGVEIIPGAPASEASFAFSKYGLYAVFARPTGTPSYNTFMDAMLAEYGNPVITQIEGVKFYVWEHGPLKIKIMRDLDRDKRAIAFYRKDRAQAPYHRKFEQHADEVCGYIPKVANIPKIDNSLIKF